MAERMHVPSGDVRRARVLTGRAPRHDGRAEQEIEERPNDLFESGFVPETITPLYGSDAYPLAVLVVGLEPVRRGR
jgi:hypothetical protein